MLGPSEGPSDNPTSISVGGLADHSGSGPTRYIYPLSRSTDVGGTTMRTKKARTRFSAWGKYVNRLRFYFLLV